MKIILPIILILSTKTIFAELKNSWICTHPTNDFVRLVRTHYEGTTCKVLYIKAIETGDHNGKKIYSAKDDPAFCNKKAFEFVEITLKQKFGWDCKKEER